MTKEKNIKAVPSLISRIDRERLNGHSSFLIWFTGLSGSGKSTLAYHLEQEFINRDINAFVLDGDNLRHGLCRDLGFTAESRKENIRRVGEVAKLFVDANVVTIASLISPVLKDRETVRDLIGEQKFIEIFCSCPLQVCESRDIKGLYAKARKEMIPNFTGISGIYEAPVNPFLEIDTSFLSLNEALSRILVALKQNGYIP